MAHHAGSCTLEHQSRMSSISYNAICGAVRALGVESWSLALAAGRSMAEGQAA